MPPVDPSLLMPDVPLRFTESNQDQGPLGTDTYIYRPPYPIQYLTLPSLSEALPEPPTPERVESVGRMIQAGWVAIQTAEDALSLAAMDSSAASLLARTQGAQIVGTAVTSEVTSEYVPVEFAYNVPVRTELTVLPADPPGTPLGVPVVERMGSALTNRRSQAFASLVAQVQAAEDERVFAALDQFAKEAEEKEAEEEYRRLNFKTRYEREQLV